MRVPKHELKELENGPYAELLERVAEALTQRSEGTDVILDEVVESDDMTEVRVSELSMRWMDAADSAYTQLAWLLHGDPTAGDNATGTLRMSLEDVVDPPFLRR